MRSRFLNESLLHIEGLVIVYWGLVVGYGVTPYEHERRNPSFRRAMALCLNSDVNASRDNIFYVLFSMIEFQFVFCDIGNHA